MSDRLDRRLRDKSVRGINMAGEIMGMKAPFIALAIIAVLVAIVLIYF